MTRFPGARMVDPVRTAGRLWLLVPRTTPADTLCPTRPHGRGAERGRPGRLARQGNCRPDGDKSDIAAMLHTAPFAVSLRRQCVTADPVTSRLPHPNTAERREDASGSPDGSVGIYSGQSLLQGRTARQAVETCCVGRSFLTEGDCTRPWWSCSAPASSSPWRGKPAASGGGTVKPPRRRGSSSWAHCFRAASV